MAEVRKINVNILQELCICINNCADCYNEETRKVECAPLASLEHHGELYLSDSSFYLNSYDKQTNEELFEVAAKYGYHVEAMPDERLRFYKEK